MERIAVEVVYARAAEQLILRHEVAQGTTLEAAVRSSGVLLRYPEIDPEKMRIGVFGRLRERTDPARSGDRIEIYRELMVDPKVSRRERAAHARRAKRANESLPGKPID